MNRVILYQDDYLGGRKDIELSDDGERLEIIELSKYVDDRWIEDERVRIPPQVLSKGIELNGIKEGIESSAKHKWERSLFRLFKKLKDGDISIIEFEKGIKYKAERHKYPKGQPRLQGGK